MGEERRERGSTWPVGGGARGVVNDDGGIGMMICSVRIMWCVRRCVCV